jgi:hypothetical protein
MSVESIDQVGASSGKVVRSCVKTFFLYMAVSYGCVIVLAPTANGINPYLYDFNFNPKFLMYSVLVSTSMYYIVVFVVFCLYLAVNKFTSKLPARIVFMRSVIAAFCFFMTGLFGSWYGNCRLNNERPDCSMVDYISLKHR